MLASRALISIDFQDLHESSESAKLWSWAKRPATLAISITDEKGPYLD